MGEAEQAARLAEAFANARAEAECAAHALVEIDRRIAEIDRHRSTVMQIIEETARLGRRWSELEPRDDELRAELERANGTLPPLQTHTVAPWPIWRRSLNAPATSRR